MEHGPVNGPEVRGTERTRVVRKSGRLSGHGCSVRRYLHVFLGGYDCATLCDGATDRKSQRNCNVWGRIARGTDCVTPMWEALQGHLPERRADIDPGGFGSLVCFSLLEFVSLELMRTTTAFTLRGVARQIWRGGGLAAVLAAVLLLQPVGFFATADAQSQADPAEPILLEDFEAYEVGSFPDRWVHVSDSKEIRTYEEARESGETVVIKKEKGNKFVRLITKNEALRFSLRNGEEFNWNLEQHPRIQWRWRAKRLPKGASERGKNDVGGAIYVTFGTDWLGRPKSIKYTYSSSLPVGSVVSFGVLHVIVVSSGAEPYTGEWKTVQRNVIGDYRQVFGGEPPERPLSITFWSDSDTTGELAKVDLDDIQLLPQYRQHRSGERR